VATAAARRYARAVFELAQQDGDVAAWGRRLTAVRELFGDSDVAAVLTNPTIAAAQREALVATAPHLIDQETSNLARLLIESGRVGDAPAIEEEYRRLADDAAGRLMATVTTAVELSREDRDRVEKELSKRIGKEVHLSVVVDARVLGGLKLQYGDRVIDATVATRLQQLRRRLAAS